MNIQISLVCMQERALDSDKIPYHTANAMGLKLKPIINSHSILATAYVDAEDDDDNMRHIAGIDFESNVSGNSDELEHTESEYVSGDDALALPTHELVVVMARVASSSAASTLVDSQIWECPSCTYMNSRHTNCEMCGGKV